MTEPWGDFPSWVAAIAGSIAALASAAVWIRGRASVDIRVRGAGRDKAEVVNVGGKPAKNVHVRVGSESDTPDVEEEKRIDQLATGEPLPVFVATDNDSARDVAVNVSWRGRFGRRETFVHRLLA